MCTVSPWTAIAGKTPDSMFRRVEYGFARKLVCISDELPEMMANIDIKITDLDIYISLLVRPVFMPCSMLTRLPTFRSLRRLRIEMSRDTIAHEGLFRFEDCKALEELVLVEISPCRGEYLQDLGSLANLRTLEIEGCRWFEDSHLSHVTSCKALETLVIKDSYIKGDFLEKIGDLTNLKTLELRRCRDISIGTFRLVADAKGLETLAIDYCFNRCVMQSFLYLPKLVKLSPTYTVEYFVRHNVRRAISRYPSEDAEDDLISSLRSGYGHISAGTYPWLKHAAIEAAFGHDDDGDPIDDVKRDLLVSTIIDVFDIAAPKWERASEIEEAIARGLDRAGRRDRDVAEDCLHLLEADRSRSGCLYDKYVGMLDRVIPRARARVNMLIDKDCVACMNAPRVVDFVPRWAHLCKEDCPGNTTLCANCLEKWGACTYCRVRENVDEYDYGEDDDDYSDDEYSDDDDDGVQ